MLYVAGHKGEEANSKSMAALQGIYYQRPEPFNERPCYQKVFLTGNAISPLGCAGLCISWTSVRKCWRIGQLSNEKAGFAMCRQDMPSPTELDVRWGIYVAPENQGKAEREDANDE